VADIDLRRHHGLGLAGARAAAEGMLEHLSRRFGLQGAWHGNVLEFERPGLKGALALTAKELHLTVTLGFLLSAMKAPLERAVTDELDQLFSRKRGSPRRKKDG
jgi:putative polyhydroxyalkanoate system protein